MKIKKESIVSLILFLIGVFCQISPLISRGLMAMYIGFCFFLFIIATKLKKIKLELGFWWYFIFVIFCLFTLSYTVNTINPDFVYIRIITYLVMLFLVSPFINEEKNVKTIVKGFIVGGLFGITIVLIMQHNIIGVKRLGGDLYGSYAEFGTVCTLTITSFMWLQKDVKRFKLLKIILFLYLALALMASGARKALLISILIPLLMQLFDKRKKMSKKIIIVTMITILSMFVIYVSLNNESLYKFIGYRIESGINAVIGEEKEDASLYERESFKRLAKEMFIERPVFGWGIHGFAMKNYCAHNFSSYFLLFSHDGFLEILSCYGIIGFILYYWIFIYIIANYKKLLYDDTGIFLLSYIIIILLMEPYSTSFLTNYYILLISACANLIYKRRKCFE